MSADAGPARVAVRAVPGSRVTQVVGEHGEALKIRVRAAPERGRANDELCAFVARELGLKRDAVTVVRGVGARDKVIEIVGMGHDEAWKKLLQST